MMLLRDKARKTIVKFIMIATVLITACFVHTDSYASDVIGSATITADSLNVRSGPGKEYDTMGKVYGGNVVEVTAVEGDWLRINYNSSTGYISIDYAEYEPDEDALIEDEEAAVEEEEADKAPDETAETEDEPTLDYKFIFGLIGAIIVILIMILITIKSIKASDYDDEYDEDDDDDEDDDEEYYEDDEEEEEEEDEDEYEYVVVKRPKTQPKQKPKSSDDFLIDIDPKYFE